jgi:hypothetical protein
VDVDMNVSGCPRQLVFNGKVGKIWDEDFWNNEMYKWLRNVHGSGISGNKQADVPKACLTCPNNRADKACR